MLVAGLCKALVSVFEIYVAEHADVLYAFDELKAEGCKASRTDTLSAVIVAGVDAFEVDDIVGFGNDICFEDKLVAIEYYEDTALFDATHNPFEEAFAVLRHRVNAAFDLGNFGLCFGNLEQFFRFCQPDVPFTFL